MVAIFSRLSRRNIAWIALLLLAPVGARAVEDFADELPNVGFPECGFCHDAPGGADASSFYQDFAAQGHVWTPTLAAQDSDADGFSNGWELQDPAGTASGTSNPGDPSLVTNPTLASDLPPAPVAADPVSLQHAEAAGTNGIEMVAIENLSGVAFDYQLETLTAWLEVDPSGGLGLPPMMSDLIDVLFTTDALGPGVHQGSIGISISGIQQSQLPEILVTLTVPEPSAGSLRVAAVAALALVGWLRRSS
jgi:hypothetical protein